jgi:hypothetical protein
VLAACASATPPSRLASYIGQEAVSGQVVAAVPAQRPIRAGLVVISDTAAPDAAPALPDEAVHRVAETLQAETSRITPFKIEKIIPSEGIQPGGDPAQLAELGRRHGVDYLVTVVLSSTEVEYPMTIFLAWVAHSQPGFRCDNWSLVEAAVVDVKAGKTVVHAEGRGWATLDRPAAPGINQWYPVIWQRPLEPNWRWFPPSYDAAPTTLRVIAMNQAVKRAVSNLQHAWIERLEAQRLASEKG